MRLLAVFTFAVFSVIFILAYLSPGLEGGMDSYNHYLISKYSWTYPSLFLDQWGKPLYNLLASPFVQFGLVGAYVLNAFSLFGCALLTYGIIRNLGLRFAWLGYIITLTSPIFLDNIISALTEPLCALLVTLTIYFYSSKRFVAAAILAGFLPFVRSEGFIILFAIALFLLFIDKKYKLLVFTLFGSALFNMLGWIIEGEPFWIITSNPYINFELSGRNICGNGGLLHYFYAGHYTFGNVASVLIALGSLFYLLSLVKKGVHTNRSLGLVFLCFVLYFLSHAALWWLGKMGSCGYVRVMLVIAPLAAVLIVFALHTLYHNAKRYAPTVIRLVFVPAMVFLVLNAVYTPYRYYAYKYPLQISAEQVEYQKLAHWYKSQNLENQRKIYLYPYFSILADINPYNETEHLDFWKSSLQFSKRNDILIWDGHFGPHESGTPLHILEQDTTWQKIHSVLPQQTILTLNDKKFEIHVFKKIK